MTRGRTASRLLSTPYIWAATTYFAEGLPFSLVRQVSPIYFKDLGASLPAIGLTSLYGLSWSLKFLWAPFLDRYGTKRKWLLLFQALLAAAVLGCAALAAGPYALAAGAAAFLAVALVSATHDIAVDGYYLEALDVQGQARFVGYRVMAYRLAMIAGAGGVVALSQYKGWPAAFATGAAVLGLLALYHARFLPDPEAERGPGKTDRIGRPMRSIATAAAFLAGAAVFVLWAWRSSLSRRILGDLLNNLASLGRLVPLSGWIGTGLLVLLLALLTLRRKTPKKPLASRSFYAASFLSFLDQERIGLALAFIVLYRTGESLLGAMAAPFLLDLGIGKAQYGLVSGTLGISCSILGALAGGAVIARAGLARAIWPFTLAQNLTNLLYMTLAVHYRGLLSGIGHAACRASLALVAAVHGFDQFAGGLGTAVFSYYLMRCCKPAFKASHFAIVSGLMTVGGAFFGASSGFLASWLGYGAFFGASFLASLPGMCLIPFLPFVGGFPTPRQGAPSTSAE